MFNLFKKKDSGLNSEVIETSANFILCFESYLLDHYTTSLLPQEMDSITELTLRHFGIEVDQLEFMLYCSSVWNKVSQKIRSIKMAGPKLRNQIDFDVSFEKYCIDLEFTRILKMIKSRQK